MKLSKFQRIIFTLILLLTLNFPLTSQSAFKLSTEDHIFTDTKGNKSAVVFKERKVWGYTGIPFENIANALLNDDIDRIPSRREFESFHNSFLTDYSSHCFKHIINPVARVITSVEITKYGNYGPEYKTPVREPYTVYLAPRFKEAFEYYFSRGIGVDVFRLIFDKNLLSTVERMKNNLINNKIYLENLIRGNCQSANVKKIMENMYRVVNSINLLVVYNRPLPKDILHLFRAGGKNMSFSPDSKRIIRAKNISGIYNKKLDQTMNDLTDRGTVRFSTDNNFLLSGAGKEHGPVKLWTVLSPTLKLKLSGVLCKNNRKSNTLCNATSFAISPDNKMVAVASYVGNGVSEQYPMDDLTNISLWDIKTATIIKSFDYTDRTTDVIQFSPDGRYLLALGHGELGIGLKKWDIKRGLLARKKIVTNTDAFRSAAISSDGIHFAIGGNSGASLWSMKKKSSLFEYSGSERDDIVLSIAFSKSGKVIAIGYFNGEIDLWDTVTNKLLKRLHYHTKGIVGLEFSNDDKLLVSEGLDLIAIVWKVDKI